MHGPRHVRGCGFLVFERCKNAGMQTRATLAVLPFLTAVLFLSTACSGPTSAPASSLGQLPDLDMNAVLAHTRTLSSDEFEGRAPGTEGERRTVEYLVGEFTKA